MTIGRSVVTVRFCSQCGVVVNDRIVASRCQGEQHAKMRRSRSAWCVDCGEHLIQAR
jgi:hypothetical protein